jgi:hypothetical protein
LTVSQNLEVDFKKPHIFHSFISFFSFSPDGFDEKKIRIIELPLTRKSDPTDATTIQSINSAEVPAVSRKRPFTNRDDSSISKEEQKQQRPRKKAGIDVHALVFPELYDNHHHPQSCSKKKSQPSAHDESNQVQRFSIFPNPSKKASRAVNQRFLSQIRRQTPADESNAIS